MKNYLMLTTLPYYKLYLTQLQEQVYTDSRFVVTSANFMVYKDTFNTSPFFSTHYVLTVFILEKNEDFFNTLIKWSQKPWVRILFCVSFMENFRVLNERLRVKKVDFTPINCYKIPNAHKVLYIQAEVYRKSDKKIQLKSSMCETIIKRAQGTEAHMDRYLDSLIVLGFDKRTINKVIKLQDSVKLGDLPMSLLLKENPKACAKTINRYHHSPKLLKDQFDTFFTNWEALYGEYRQGLFSPNSYIAWIPEKGKKFNIHSEYTANRWFKLFNSYSFGYLYDFRYRLNQINKYDWYELALTLYLLTGVVA